MAPELTNISSVSIGISRNILLARLATRHAKPGGVFYLGEPDIPGFMACLDVADLHGFAWSAKKKLEEKFGSGMSTVPHILGKSKDLLISILGKKTGETLYNAVRGIDETKIQSDRPRKSVSAEINVSAPVPSARQQGTLKPTQQFGIRFETNEQARDFIFKLSEEVSRRLIAVNKFGRSISLKVMKRHPNAPKEAAKVWCML